jgi:hypothetical protein
MNLVIYNGSPRGEKSNTAILMQHFLRGYMETPGNTAEIHYLNQTRHRQAHVEAFRGADAVILAHPLYTDAMPALALDFIQALKPFCGRSGNPPLGFIVQSGFSEAEHSSYVAKYYQRLAARLGSPYLGTVIRGGVEGIKVQPASWTQPLFTALYRLGQQFGADGKFDPALVAELGKFKRFTGLQQILYRLLMLTGLTNFYWDTQLKQNHALERVNARPYAEDQ